MKRLAHAAIHMLAATGVATLSTTSCASHAQTAPVYRETATAGSTEATVQEEFDPARFREDLLLITPVFPPPEAVSLTDPPDTVTPALDLADSISVVYRVQVIALRQENGAQRIATELQRRFDIPTEVTPQGRLFAVRVGHLASTEDAEQLRSQIADLSRGYEGAFLISDTLYTAPALPDTESDVPMVDPATAAIDADSVSPIESPAVEPELFRTQGWRVLIGQFMDLAGAQEYRKQVIKRLKREDVDVIFEAPRFKVLAGSFRTSTQAQQFVERCRTLGFRTAARVPGEVYLPREEGEIR
jgi:cell division septation protein DedD